MDTAQNTPSIIRSFLSRNAATFKMAWVIILVLVLLIPLSMVRSVLRERTTRRNEAVANITSTWGGEQSIVGPVLVIPFQYKTKVWKEQTANGKTEKTEVEETATAHAYLLPAELIVSSSIVPSRRHRGIYEAVLYEGQLDISGRFAPPDLVALGIAAEDMQWDKAALTLAVSDMRGTSDIVSVRVGEQDFAFAPGCKLPGYASGITTRLPGIASPGSELDFRMALDLKGSKGIRFAPVGKQNRIGMASPWSAPSFGGAFLPASHQITNEGFTANWEMSWYGRSYPQESTDRPGGQALAADRIAPSLFGVDFLIVVDSYRLVERATKYGVLFIALLFTVFFLFEVLSALRIHTIQYALVGVALCLFYLAVLSLSEFVPFACAYWTGALASALLIVLYCVKILKGGKRTTIIAAALMAIYAYLYVVLQMQDYSLLFGTAGLFAVLGIVMYSTRNLDWSKRY